MEIHLLDMLYLDDKDDWTWKIEREKDTGRIGVVLFQVSLFNSCFGNVFHKI